MTYDTAVVDGLAAGQPARRSRKPSPQAVVAHGGLAATFFACAFTLYTNIAGPGVTAFAAIAPESRVASTFALLEEMPARPVESRVISNSAVKADRLPIAPPQQVAALPQAPEAAAAAPAVAATTEAAPAAAAPEALRQVAALVPLPKPRPASLRANPEDGPSRREIAQANKAAVLAAISAPKPSIFERLFGRQSGPTLAFAAPDGGITSDGQSLTPGGAPLYDKQTAVYDISARTVYMPDGTRLEAHSGLGDKLDDPRFVHLRMRGPTPPHVYELSLRESLFHGVEALRLKPIGGEDKVFGRTGLLAHTYMLGPRGDSNGCVSFRNYEAFLRAFKNNEVKRLAVVARLD